MTFLIFEMSIKEMEDTIIGSLQNKDYNDNDSNSEFIVFEILIKIYYILLL